MLDQDRLAIAIDIQRRSYRLLLWLGDAIERGFVPVTHAHANATAAHATIDWIKRHYENLPPAARPDRADSVEFANFFGTYLTTSFEIDPNPERRFDSDSNCYCPMCSYLARAPRLKLARVPTREKKRALNLMAYRLLGLAMESGLSLRDPDAVRLARDPTTRRSAAYSTYGYWLIRRLDGVTDGLSILALWREIAWNRSGSPIPGFELTLEETVRAEERLVAILKECRSG